MLFLATVIRDLFMDGFFFVNVKITILKKYEI